MGMRSGGTTPRFSGPTLAFSVRPLQEGDVEALAAFYGALSAESAHFFEPYKDTSVAAMREVVRRAAEGVDVSLAVLDGDGRIVGHIFYLDVSKDIPHLGIGLLDAYHDQGLGSALLVYLIGVGRHVLGKQTIGLTVLKDNRRAFHLYRKHGFQTVRDVTFRDKDDSYEMWLRFGAAKAEPDAGGD